MMELRWLVDSRSDAHRVLQYRTLYDKVAATQAAAVVPWPFNNTKEWTPWMDVPEQTDSAHESKK